MGLFSRTRSGVTQASFTPVDGEQLFVGEMSYQPHLTNLLVGLGYSTASLTTCTQPVSETFVARLVPEPRNPHDPNAVAVQIEGRTAAYLSRANAARYRAAFRSQTGEMRVVLWVKPQGKGIVSVWPER